MDVQWRWITSRHLAQGAHVAVAVPALSYQRRWEQQAPATTGGACQRPQREPHVAIRRAVDYERLLAGDRVPWAGAIGEAAPIRFLDDGDHPDRLS